MLSDHQSKFNKVSHVLVHLRRPLFLWFNWSSHLKGHLKNLNARRIQVLLKSKTMLGKGEKRMEKLKIVFLHNVLKWVSSDFYQTSVAFAGIFLTSISSQCCGMASYFGA